LVVGSRAGFSTFDAAYWWKDFVSRHKASKDFLIASEDVSGYFPSMPRVTVSEALLEAGAERWVVDRLLEQQVKMMDRGEEGLCQGAPSSPMLALAGMVQILLEQGFRLPESVLATAYVDDITLLALSKEAMDRAREGFQAAFKTRGLGFKEAKSQLLWREGGRKRSVKSLGWALWTHRSPKRRQWSLRFYTLPGWIGWKDYARSFRTNFSLAASKFRGRMYYNRVCRNSKAWLATNYQFLWRNAIGNATGSARSILKRKFRDLTMTINRFGPPKGGRRYSVLRPQGYNPTQANEPI
jgi:hypothetical protein